ncbi:hypothetical protein NP493_772g02027 [Ridgeia piscesae]|uniref:Choline/carnitine acyltransferase domain-containing protein n=1 Tax=Ridgeia piscesae TaxID=27915 RepID=A0AAD9KP07_RIDPI|nr:hypothetical protein NP493_772g02027 [Ridgeia piscesae]
MWLRYSVNLAKTAGKPLQRWSARQNVTSTGDALILSRHVWSLKRSSPCEESSSEGDSLPHLPVPPLQQTLDKLMLSATPLIASSQLSASKQVVERFGECGGIGDKLQHLLEEKANKTVNWLEDWWLNVAYLDYRKCVPINVSPGVVLPEQSFTDQQQQLRFAAKLIAGLLDYKVLIDGHNVPQEYMGGQPLCMTQYYKILSSCRVPLPGRDAVRQFSSDDAKHIVVIHNNHFFSVDVYGKNGEQLSQDQLYQQLRSVVERSPTLAPPVGILTANERDTWAEVSKVLQAGCWGGHQGVGEDIRVLEGEHQGVEGDIRVLAGHQGVGEDIRVLAGHQGVGGTSGCWRNIRVLAEHQGVGEDIRVLRGASGYPTNGKTIAEIQKSIFVLNLDRAMPETKTGDERYSVMAAQMNHGGGSAHNSANRWFDKTLQEWTEVVVWSVCCRSGLRLWSGQFVVGVDGAVGITYEHCAAEGPPVIAIVDHTFTYCQSKVQDKKPAAGVQEPTQLPFKVTPEIDLAIKQAAGFIDKEISDIELIAFKFMPFGKEFIKSQKLSPDAFVQVNLQLAYYRLHGKPTATYESGSLRKYVHGRTDTIRSCSIDSHNYCLAMQDKNVSAADKIKALRSAVAAHSKYTREVTNGQGIDRHLLGLKLLASENKMATPELFQHPVYTDSGYWKLSTSQVPSKHDSLLCFGAVVNDGYGFCYNPMADHMNFSVSAWRSCSETSAARFEESITTALTDAQQLLLSNRSQG